MALSTAEITQLLQQWRVGRTEALADLLPAVHAELRRLAASYLRRERHDHTLQATALVNEAFIKLVDQRGVQWQNRAHFFGIAAQLMRRILVDYARAHAASKRGSGERPLSLDEVAVIAPPLNVDLLLLDAALTRLEQLDPQQSRVVELRFFGGLTIDETAEALHISPATVGREWTVAKAWLFAELGSRGAMNAERWGRVKTLFHDLVDRSPEERDAVLDAACVGDAELRREVQRLLDAHGQAGSFIEGSPIERGVVAAAATVSLTGRVVGHYQIGRLVGVGGIGEVYEARDLELGRAVALKVVTDGTSAAQLGLRQEAQHASKLNHPHICTIHDVGAFEDRAYVVMEYVQGRTLSAVIDARPLPVESVLRYGAQLADALAHAHGHGVIHRDFKSANVAVTGEGRAKVLDFGLARSISNEQVRALSQSATALADDDLVAGTLPYMAPEVLRGAAPDARGDIWALGVVLHEMSTGKRPFSGETVFDLSSAILSRPPESLAGRVPAGLEAIIRRCLAKDPHDRYAQAGEVRAALESVRGEVETGHEAAPSPRTITWVVSSRRAAMVALMLLSLAAVSFAIVRWTSPETGKPAAATGPPSLAVMNFENPTGQEDTAWLSRGIPSMLLTSLAQTRGLRLVSTQHLHEAVRQLGMTLDTIESGQVADVARRAGAGAVVVGTVVKSGTELRIDAQVADLVSGQVLLAESVRGTDLFPLVDQLAARIRDSIGVGNTAGIRSVTEVSSKSVEAYRLYSEGMEAMLGMRMDDAERALTQAVAIDPAFAEAYLRLAGLSEFQNRPAAQARYLRDAASHPDRLSERQRMLAEVEWAREEGDFSRAARALDTVIERFPDFKEAYASAVLYEPGRGAVFDPEKPISLYGKGVQALPFSGGMRNFYAYALLFVGRHAEGVRELEAYARLAPREANPYDSLGEAYLMMGLPEKSIEHYSRALTIDPTFTGSRNGRAWALAMLGQYDRAIADDPTIFAVKAFLLARVGRYREAATAISAGIREAERDEDAISRGDVELLNAVLAIERGDAERALRETRAAAPRFAPSAEERNRLNLVLVDLVAGLAEMKAGRPVRAREHLEAMRRRYRAAWPPEQFWFNALRGDIALAEGRLDEAADAYAAGEPKGRMWSNFSRSRAPSILANNLMSRDGLARVRKARGDLPGAIQEYRRLTTAGTGQPWMAMLEPRYVLELARLLDRTGDKPAALVEYRRALDLFKNADAGVPELAEIRRALAGRAE